MIEELRDLEVMRLEPDDVLVLKSEGMLSHETMQVIGKQLKYIGIKNKVIVLDRGFTLSILREQEVTDNEEEQKNPEGQQRLEETQGRLSAEQEEKEI